MFCFILIFINKFNIYRNFYYFFINIYIILIKFFNKNRY